MTSYILKYLLLFTITIYYISVSNIFSTTLDDQVRYISGMLMCPVCQGQSVSESNSQLAKDMRTTIRTQLQQGRNKDEILKYFVSRYGDTILASPPPRGINLLIWIMPIMGIIFIGILLGNFIYKKGKLKINNSNFATYDKTHKYSHIEEDLKKYD